MRRSLSRSSRRGVPYQKKPAGAVGRTRATHAQERWLVGKQWGRQSWHLRGSAGQADHRLVDEGLLHQVADEREVDAVDLRR